MKQDLQALIARWREEAKQEAFDLYSAKTPTWNIIRTNAGRMQERCADELAAVLAQQQEAPQMKTLTLRARND